ncbi:hypothetical protein OBBRIDRAFT_754960 [Obba rivulosa]|uniref:DUF6533 domain-containing protein n=1 Tax=Obba rivulosa TaxID=1052685 RepID=A0A8E2DKV2_9APHY|nr:hypothetical protein OBBRIDRAFT_754960 [Obba rivulosa]
MFLYGPHVIDKYALLLFLQANWIGSCCTVAASTMVFYHHISTLAQEIELIWGRKWSSVTMLFHLNRWAIFVWAVQEITSLIPLKTLSSCIGLQLANDAVGILLAVIWAVFSAVRLFAISGRNSWLAGAVLLLNLIPVGTNAYTDFASSWEQLKNLPLLGVVCDSGNNLSPTTLFKVTLSTRLCGIVADIIALIVTWHRTWHLKRNADRSELRTPLPNLLFRDGTIYFVVLLASNVLNIVANDSNVFVFSVTFFSTPISSIIIADFLLNLREVAYGTQQVDSDYVDQSEEWSHSLGDSLRFRSFIDDMGGEVYHSYDSFDPDMAWVADEDSASGDKSVLSAPLSPVEVEAGLKAGNSFISLGSNEDFLKAVMNESASFNVM